MGVSAKEVSKGYPRVEEATHKVNRCEVAQTLPVQERPTGMACIKSVTNGLEKVIANFTKR